MPILKLTYYNRRHASDRLVSVVGTTSSACCDELRPFGLSFVTTGLGRGCLPWDRASETRPRAQGPRPGFFGLVPYRTRASETRPRARSCARPGFFAAFGGNMLITLLACHYTERGWCRWSMPQQTAFIAHSVPRHSLPSLYSLPHYDNADRF